MARFSDQEILQGIREGDRDIFHEVFDAHYGVLCHYAFTIIRDSDEAEDMVQSIYAKLWEQRSTIDITISVRAYLFKSVYKKCMNFLEHREVKRNHNGYTVHSTLGEHQQPEVFPEELEENIKRAINALPLQCRTIFIMSRYDGLKHSEISERMNISVNTIQNQICKALKILRIELKDIIE